MKNGLWEDSIWWDEHQFDYLLYYSGSGVFSEGRLYPDWTAIEEYPIYDEFGRNMNY